MSSFSTGTAGYSGIVRASIADGNAGVFVENGSSTTINDKPVGTYNEETNNGGNICFMCLKKYYKNAINFTNRVFVVYKIKINSGKDTYFNNPSRMHRKNSVKSIDNFVNCDTILNICKKEIDSGESVCFICYLRKCLKNFTNSINDYVNNFFFEKCWKKYCICFINFTDKVFNVYKRKINNKKSIYSTFHLRKCYKNFTNFIKFTNFINFINNNHISNFSFKKYNKNFINSTNSTNLINPTNAHINICRYNKNSLYKFYTVFSNKSFFTRKYKSLLVLCLAVLNLLALGA